MLHHLEFVMRRLDQPRTATTLSQAKGPIEALRASGHEAQEVLGDTHNRGQMRSIKDDRVVIFDEVLCIVHCRAPDVVRRTC
jgi:hypothetical protein